MSLPPDLQLLVYRRGSVQAECRAWQERGWEFVPDEIVQAALDADKALLAWFDGQPAQPEPRLTSGELRNRRIEGSTVVYDAISDPEPPESAQPEEERHG